MVEDAGDLSSEEAEKEGIEGIGFERWRGNWREEGDVR